MMQGRRAERVEDDVATRSRTQSAVPPMMVAAGRLRLSVREPAQAAAEVPPSAPQRGCTRPSLSSLLPRVLLGRLREELLGRGWHRREAVAQPGRVYTGGRFWSRGTITSKQHGKRDQS